ncbi:MAG: cation diffusion facilitator family transporter, partial [Glaciihabitans sp.]|nr:cation diffusion facilitator family transporter [Glaciihabitans sp.]
RRFLVGQEANSDMDRAAVRTLLEQAEIDRVTYVHLEFVGPERVFLVAAIDLAGDEPESAVAVTLRALEDRITRSDNIEQAVLTLSTASEPSLEG